MYATLTQLKTYLTIDGTGDDTLLSDCLLRAQTMIETATRRKFEASVDTSRTFDAISDVMGRTLYLDTDLCAITSITNGDGDSITAADIVSEPRTTAPYYALTLKRTTGLAWTYEDDPEDAITVTGRFAYSTVAPADIEQACLRLAAWLYRQKDNSADLDRPMVSADGATLMPMQIPNDVRAMIAPYTRVAVR